MEITDKTYCGKKTQDGYTREKAWGNVVAKDIQIGHHRPTLEQLSAKNWMVYVDNVCNPDTEKLALDLSDDGSIISYARIDLTAEDIAHNESALIAVNVSMLWQAAHDYEYEQISGSAIGLIAMGVLGGFPKALAVQVWIKCIWEIYYTRKAVIQAGGVADNDFTSCGPIPHTVPELMEEAGV